MFCSWTLTDRSPDSGSVTLEVDVPTGFFVRKDILRKYQKLSRLPIARYRHTKHLVTASLDAVSTPSPPRLTR